MDVGELGRHCTCFSGRLQRSTFLTDRVPAKEPVKKSQQAETGEMMDKKKQGKPNTDTKKLGIRKNVLKPPLVDNQVSQFAEQMAERVRDSANQIWLAGLGAYSKAEEEGTKLFENLVEDGEKIEARTRYIVEKPFQAAKEHVETVRARATDSWEKVEKAFDLRVSKALNRLNIPSRSDVDQLRARVESLQKQVDALARQVSSQDKNASSKGG